MSAHFPTMILTIQSVRETKVVLFFVGPIAFPYYFFELTLLYDIVADFWTCSILSFQLSVSVHDCDLTNCDVLECSSRPAAWSLSADTEWLKHSIGTAMSKQHCAFVCAPFGASQMRRLEPIVNDSHRKNRPSVGDHQSFQCFCFISTSLSSCLKMWNISKRCPYISITSSSTIHKCNKSLFSHDTVYDYVI